MQQCLCTGNDLTVNLRLFTSACDPCRVFCQSTGFGGTIKEGHDVTKVKNWQMFDHGILPLYLSVCCLLLNSKVETMEKKKERLLTIKFNADTAAQMRWLRLS